MTRLGWGGVVLLIAGLYVLAYLVATVGSIFSWLFPTGIIAIFMIVAGAYRIFRDRRSEK
jgi:CHASE2 domain-containing sensor protein